MVDVLETLRSHTPGIQPAPLPPLNADEDPYKPFWEKQSRIESKITEIDYQPGVNEMQLRGKLKQDVEDARAGSYQRILIEIARPFQLIKKCWDKFAYQEISEAANPISNATVAAVMMQSGLAHICIVGRNTTIVKAKVTKAIPKVKARGAGNSEAKQKFFQMTADALIREVPIKDMKCIIIASPGFLQSEFYNFLHDNASKLGILNAFQENKIVQATSSSGIFLPSYIYNTFRNLKQPFKLNALIHL